MTSSGAEAPKASTVVAKVASLCGLGGAALAALGVVGIQLRLLSPFVGFRVFLLGTLIGGLLALVLGIVALVATRRAANPAGQPNAAIGLVLGLGLLAIVVFAAAPGAGLPRINDVTTDLEDPPRFTAAADASGNRVRDMGYPAEFVAQARSAYPDLESIRLDVPAHTAFERALEAAEDLGWEITLRDPEDGVFEARDVSAIFRFVDDVRVRVRPADAGSVVDVRSRSRVGQGDLGANAARIRAFADALRSGP